MASWRKKWRLVLLLWGMATLWGGHPAWALVINPARTEVRLSPGKKQTLHLTVFNDTQDKLNVEVSVKDWFVLPANKGLTVEKWLKVSGRPLFELKPGESRKIKVTVSCPKDAQGELVGMVSFMYQADQPSMVTPIISVSVYVEAVGTEKLAGDIRELKVNTYQGKAHVQANVECTGNVHLRPSGHVDIIDATGKIAANLPIPEGGPAYPGRVAPYTSPETIKLDPGRYTAKANLVYKGLEMKASQGFTVSPEGQIEMVGSVTK